jgi:hypothetical protein
MYRSRKYFMQQRNWIISTSGSDLYNTRAAVSFISINKFLLFSLSVTVFYLFFFICIIHSYAEHSAARYYSPSKQQEAGKRKLYIIIVSANEFRYDLANKYHAEHLRIKTTRRSADYITPYYHSLTLPNHNSIVTGLYPAYDSSVDSVKTPANLI